MTANESSKKDEQISGTLDMSELSKGKQQLKSALPKNSSRKRRTRVVQRRSPNLDAATEVVTRSVAARSGKRENSKPKATFKDSQILVDGVKTETRSPAARRRKKDTTATEKLQKSSATTHPTTKRRVKRDQSSVRLTEAKSTHKKPSSRKSQKRSRTAKTVSESTPLKPESTKVDKAAKKTTSKRTPQQKSVAKSKDGIESATKQRKSTPNAKRKPRKTRTKTVTPPVTRRPVDIASDDYVIGFQGIYYKPYRLTNKDLFMSGAQQDHFMDILIRAKDKLLAEEADRANQLQENDASNLPDPLDQGTNEGVFHNQLRTRDRESQLVRKINRAIDCLKTGSYGYCEACGCEIPIRRLEARPIVTKCIDCKERDELRERQLGQ